MADGKRSDTLRVRLAPEILDRLEKAAARHGFTLATYAAFAISRHLVEEEDRKQAVRLGVLEASRRSVDSVMGQLDLAELLKAADAATDAAGDALSHAKTEALPPAPAGA